MLFVPPESSIEDAKQSGIKWPRIGLAYIAAYLREKGVIVKVLDCRALGLKMNNIADSIKGFDPDILASGPFTEEILSTYEVFKLARELTTGITNVIGEPHATAIPEKTLKEFPEIDIIVYGEGEISMADLVGFQSKEDLHKINGIMYRNGKGIIKNKPNPQFEDIDKLPYPAWDLFPLHARAREGKPTGVKRPDAANGAIPGGLIANIAFDPNITGQHDIENEGLKTKVTIAETDGGIPIATNTFLRPSNYTRNWRLTLDKSFMLVII